MESGLKVIHKFHCYYARLDTDLEDAINTFGFNWLYPFSTEISSTITTSF